MATPTKPAQSNTPKSGRLSFRKFSRKQLIIALSGLILVGLVITASVFAAGLRKKVALVFSSNSANVSRQGDGSFLFQAPTTGGDHDLSAFNNTSQSRFRAYQDIPESQLPAPGAVLTDKKFGYNDSNKVEGQFRVFCQYSHFNYDDPIVYPGHEGHGKAHLHMYFGNTTVNSDTTGSTLANIGGGTCHGYETNRTAYWVPALRDKNDQVRIPRDIVIYYKSMPEKSGDENINAAATQEMPQGLKMIASTEQARAGVIAWQCYNGNGDPVTYSGATIPPSCPPDKSLSEIIEFPPCWKGKGADGNPILDSPDHKSHMAYMMYEGGRWVCPSTHPVKLPRVSYHIYYNNEDFTGWYLSSDRHNGANYPGGQTLHADWFGGWNKSAMTDWTKNCIQAKRNCSNGVMSDSKRLVNVMVNNGGDNPSGREYAGPWVLPIPLAH